jgi:hypothetical protein
MRNVARLIMGYYLVPEAEGLNILSFLKEGDSYDRG